MLLHTEAFTHSTQKLCTYRKSRNFTSVFGDRPSFRAKGLQREPGNRNFASVFGDRPSFRAKGLQREPGNRNFTSVFDDRTSFRAKGLRRTSWNRNFASVFDDRTSFRAKGLRGTGGNRNFTSVEPRFVRKGCVSCRLVGTAPAPAFRRDIEKKERARGARGEEGKRARGEDVR